MQSLAENRLGAIGLREGPPIGSLASLDDTTLLALMLSKRPSFADPHRVAADLFDRFGGLAAIASADLCELSRIDGVCPAVMTDLKLLRLLCERMSRCAASRRPVVSSWSALLAYVRVALAEEPREQFRTLFLDRKNQLLRDEMVSQGTVDHAPVYVATVIECFLALTAGRPVTISRQCASREGGR